MARIERKPGSMVTLVTPNGMKQEFELLHAERILRTPNNGGWMLPTDSPYQYDYYDGITKRSNQGDIEAPASQN